MKLTWPMAVTLALFGVPAAHAFSGKPSWLERTGSSTIFQSSEPAPVEDRGDAQAASKSSVPVTPGEAARDQVSAPAVQPDCAPTLPPVRTGFLGFVDSVMRFLRGGNESNVEIRTTSAPAEVGDRGTSARAPTLAPSGTASGGVPAGSLEESFRSLEQSAAYTPRGAMRSDSASQGASGGRRTEVKCEPELKVGDPPRVYDIGWDKAPMSVEMRYKLIRKSEKDYEAVVNPQFLDARTITDPTRGGTPNAQVHRDMSAKVAKCFRQVENQLFAPDGRKIRIRLPQEGEADVPEVPINVRANRSREFNDSGNYVENVTCPTILHETLHLMGFVDEYEGVHSGAMVNRATGEALTTETNASEYPCRVQGHLDSIMSGNYDAFKRVFGGSGGVWSVTCSCKDWICNKWMENNSGTKMQVPPRAQCDTTVGDTTTWKEESGLDPLETPSRVEQLGGGRFKIISGRDPGSQPVPGQSLLEPAYFDALLNPGCAVNREFYTCAKQAYRKLESGESCNPESLPTACRDGRTGWTGRAGK